MFHPSHLCSPYIPRACDEEFYIDYLHYRRVERVRGGDKVCSTGVWIYSVFVEGMQTVGGGGLPHSADKKSTVVKTVYHRR